MTRASIRFVALFLSGAMWLESSSTFSEESNVKPPLTIGAPHYCGQHYPQHALDNEIEGRVGLKVIITNEGDIANPVVTETSGNAELDAAAVACVLGWKFQPAQRDGKSVTVSGTLHVNWRLPYIPFVERRQCFNHYGVTPQQRPNKGETIVTFRIESGQVLDASVLLTSGNAELDRNAIACVESWRYAATNDDGTPTRRHMKEIILWVPGPSEESGNERVCHSKVGVGFLGDHTHRTRIAFTVDGDGTVKNPYIWVSSGNMYLDGESLECVSKWRYRPIIVDGKPTEFPWDIGIDWQPLCFALCPSIYR
jgi:TonB family protein